MKDTKKVGISAVSLVLIGVLLQVVDEALALVKKDIASVEDELQKLAKASANTSVRTRLNLNNNNNKEINNK